METVGKLLHGCVEIMETVGKLLPDCVDIVETVGKLLPGCVEIVKTVGTPLWISWKQWVNSYMAVLISWKR